MEDSRQLLSFTVGLDREEFFELTSKIRASLPDEVRKAHRVTSESERIVGGAREAAEATVNDAQQEAQRLLQNSQGQAEKVLAEAEERSQTRVQEADGYAKKVVAEAQLRADEALDEARQQAERLVAEARQQASQMISESEVMRLATAQAKEIVAIADRDGRDMRHGAEEYAREELVRLEKIIEESLMTIGRGRTKLDQRLASYDEPLPVAGGSRTAQPQVNPEMIRARR